MFSSSTNSLMFAAVDSPCPAPSPRQQEHPGDQEVQGAEESGHQEVQGAEESGVRRSGRPRGPSSEDLSH